MAAGNLAPAKTHVSQQSDLQLHHKSDSDIKSEPPGVPPTIGEHRQSREESLLLFSRELAADVGVGSMDYRNAGSFHVEILSVQEPLHLSDHGLLCYHRQRCSGDAEVQHGFDLAAG